MGFYIVFPRNSFEQSWAFKKLTVHRTSLFLWTFTFFHNHSVYYHSPPFCTFPLHLNTLDESVLFLLVVLQSLRILTFSTFYTFHIISDTKEKTKSFNLTSNIFSVKFKKYLTMKNLFVCIITSENNNEQYLVSYFYKHIAFLSFFKRTYTLHYHSSHIF